MLSQLEKEKVGKVVSKNSFGFMGLWVIAVTSAVAVFIVNLFYYDLPIYFTLSFVTVVGGFTIIMILLQSKNRTALLKKIENNESIIVTEEFQLSSLKGMAAVQYVDGNGQQKKASLPSSYSNQFLTKKQFLEKSQLKKVVIVTISDKKAIAIDYESIKD